MTNYGGLILLRPDGTIREWGTTERRWLIEDLPFGEWLDKAMREGEAIAAELHSPDGL
jgi:hypothetical protein